MTESCHQYCTGLPIALMPALYCILCNRWEKIRHVSASQENVVLMACNCKSATLDEEIRNGVGPNRPSIGGWTM